MNVEQVHHPKVLGPGHALNRADNGGRFRAAQDVPQRQAAGNRIGIRVVMQHDQHAIGVAEIALVLLHTRARQRPAELGEKRSAEELGHRQVRHVGKLRCGDLQRAWRSTPGRRRGRRRACRRVANGLEDFSEAAAGVVFDDDAGAGADVGFENVSARRGSPTVALMPAS